MKSLIASTLALSVVLTGCAAIQNQTGMDGKSVGAAGGAVIGCAGGVLLAKIAGRSLAGGCAAGAVVGGLAGFAKARESEIADAKAAQQEAISALAPLAAAKSVRVGEVKTVEVTATDVGSKETKKFQAFDSVSLDIPLSTKGTPEYNAAFAKLKALATKVADERGSSKIDVAMTAGDARSNKVTLETADAKTAKGNTITVSKVADNSIQKGMERVTISAGKIQKTEVS